MKAREKITIELTKEEAEELFDQVNHLVMHEAMEDPAWYKWLPMVDKFMTGLARKIGRTDRLRSK